MIKKSELHSREISNGCAALFISGLLFSPDSAVFTGGFARIIKARIKGIEVFGIQLLLHGTQCLSETLEMNYLSGAEEPDRVCNFRDISYHTEDIVVGGSRLLLWGDFVRTTLHNII